MSTQSNVVPLTVGPQEYGQNCILDYGRTYATNCWQSYQEPRITVHSVLTKMSAEELVELQKRIPGELATRISALEKSAQEASRVLELARQALSEVKP